MIRASVNLIPEAPVASVVEAAVEAESLGFQRCWVYDEGLATRDVYVTMTAIASATTRIEVGPGITNPYTRHPGQTASAIATLDEVSGGRAFLGVGAGGSLTLQPLGIERRRPLVAVPETIEVCRSLFGGRHGDYEGETVNLDGARLDYARADIEIWLAGRGPRMLTLGGRHADGVMLDFIHRDLIGEHVARVRDGAAERDTPVQIAYATVLVTDDGALERVKPHMTYRLVDSQPQVRERLGITDAEIDSIRDAMAGGLEAAAEFVRDEWVLPFVIHGTRTECSGQIADLVDEHGFSEFMLPVLDLTSAGAVMSEAAEVLGLT